MIIRLLMFAGQAADTATFAIFVLVVPSFILSQIIGAERNGTTFTLYAIGGLAGVVFVKMGLTTLFLWGDHRYTWKRRRLRLALMSAAAVTGFVGAAFNALAVNDFMNVMRSLVH